MKHDAIKQLFGDEKKVSSKKSRTIGRRGKKRLNPDGSDKFFNGLNSKFLTYEQAKIFCHAASFITTAAEYKDWVRIKKYKFLPLTPNIKYRDEWEGWGEFLGTGNPGPNAKRTYMSYIEAKMFAQKMAIKHDLLDGHLMANWLNFLDNQMALPEAERDVGKNVNRHPQEYYDEWEGWPVFMGKNLKSKVDAMQQARKQEIEREIQEDFYSYYQNVRIVAILGGVDPIKPNVVAIVHSQGLLNLLTMCDRNHADILAAYEYNPDREYEFMSSIQSQSQQISNELFSMRNVNATISDIATIFKEIPKDHLK